jgi:hypothetical protein
VQEQEDRAWFRQHIADVKRQRNDGEEDSSYSRPLAREQAHFDDQLVKSQIVKKE